MRSVRLLATPTLIVAGTAVALVIGATALSPSRVAAECVRTDAWPSFTKVAPAAQRVIVGTVVSVGPPDSADYSGAFSLRVDEVLRGQPIESLAFEAFRSGLPVPICDTYLRVQKGDVLAFALGARLHEWGSRVVSTYAYIQGTPDPSFSIGVEQLSLEAVRAIASLPPTDAARQPTGQVGPNEDRTLLVLAAAFGAVLAWRRLSRTAFGHRA